MLKCVTRGICVTWEKVIKRCGLIKEGSLVIYERRWCVSTCLNQIIIMAIGISHSSHTHAHTHTHTHTHTLNDHAGRLTQ